MCLKREKSVTANSRPCSEEIVTGLSEEQLFTVWPLVDYRFKLIQKVGRWVIGFNAQSTVSVISGRNTIHINHKSKYFHISILFRSLCLERFGRK